MNCDLCQLPELNSSEFLNRLRRSDHGNPRVPLTASLELTSSCNLRCRHCYLDTASAAGNFLPLDHARTILHDLAANEALMLVLTGGEPLMHPDFIEIYRLSRRLGFVVILFTNATRITSPILETLRDLPPRRIEISVYGRTRETYESVTGVSGSFDRFLQGVHSLLDNGFAVELKCVVMRSNRHEFEAIRDWAADLGCPFRYDPLIHCSLAGSTGPVRERIPAHDAAGMQMADPEDRRQFLNYAAKVSSLPPQQRLFECGAGSHIIHIDARGLAHPCAIWRQDPFDLTTRTLRDGWAEHIARLRSLPASPGECVACNDRGLCGRCAPISLLETSDAGKAIPFYCELARLRRQFVLAPPPNTASQYEDYGSNTE